MAVLPCPRGPGAQGGSAAREVPPARGIAPHGPALRPPAVPAVWWLPRPADAGGLSGARKMPRAARDARHSGPGRSQQLWPRGGRLLSLGCSPRDTRREAGDMALGHRAPALAVLAALPVAPRGLPEAPIWGLLLGTQEVCFHPVLESGGLGSSPAGVRGKRAEDVEI